jgi:hypothetical protein
VEDQKCVIWSDETKVNRIGSYGRDYVWKRQGEPLGDRLVKGTVKFGGGSLMVQASMGWNGVGILAEVEGRMDTEQYMAILNDHLLPSMEESGISGKISSSCKTMTQIILSREPGIGLKTMESLS